MAESERLIEQFEDAKVRAEQARRYEPAKSYEAARQKVDEARDALRSHLDSQSQEIERLRKVGRSAATAIRIAIECEDGLDGNEGSNVLDALEAHGIEPYPLHEEGCVMEWDGAWFKPACVESCYYHDHPSEAASLLRLDSVSEKRSHA